MRAFGSFNGYHIFLAWSVIYALLWAALSGGGGWGFGLPTALLAACLATRMGLQPWAPRLIQIPALLWFFLREMCSGAWDVARRVLSPSCPVAPAWVRFSLTEEDRRVRYLLSLTIGLLPGSVSSRIIGNELEVHVLDCHMQWRHTAAELERRLASLLAPRSV